MEIRALNRDISNAHRVDIDKYTLYKLEQIIEQKKKPETIRKPLTEKKRFSNIELRNKDRRTFYKEQLIKKFPHPNLMSHNEKQNKRSEDIFDVNKEEIY